jgi:hypothetical protein
MLWAAPLLLAGVTATHPVGPASTYDEAACDEETVVAPPVVEKCEEAEPVVVIDCDDPGMTPWVAEMIGSCEMPRALPPGFKPATVKAARTAWTARTQGGLTCGNDCAPIRPGAFGSDENPPALAMTIDLKHVLGVSQAPHSLWMLPLSPPPQRLERPPRG